MMEHVSLMRSEYLHHDGAFFVFSGLISDGDFTKTRPVFSLAEPRGSAHIASFSLSESVIVGYTLPSEASVSPAPILKEVTLYFQG